MRITLLSPPLNLSGGLRVMAIHADGLRRRGHVVTVVAPPNPRPTLRQLVRSAVQDRTIPRHRRRSASHFDGLEVDCRLLDRHRPITDADLPDADVVIATWWETAEWAAGLSPSKGAKVYFLQHYETHDHQPAERVKSTWRLPFFKVVVAGWLADLARDRFGDDAAVVVPNAVDLDQFRAPRRDKNDHPVVGLYYAGQRWKGTDIALEAARLARRERPDLRLVAFGFRPPTPNLPIPPNLDYSVNPPQERIREVYARCDAWLFASRSEGFGLPILEAMACRTPVIGTPAGAAPELLAGGGGILVAPEAPADMARAILRIAAMDRSEWLAISDAAHATAAGYTWDDATDRFEEALFRAIESTSSSA